MMVHKEVIANLAQLKLPNFEDIDLPAKALEDKTIRYLIMNSQSKTGDKLFIVIELSWHGELTLWVK